MGKRFLKLWPLWWLFNGNMLFTAMAWTSVMLGIDGLRLGAYWPGGCFLIVGLGLWALLARAMRST